MKPFHLAIMLCTTFDLSAQFEMSNNLDAKGDYNLHKSEISFLGNWCLDSSTSNYEIYYHRDTNNCQTLSLRILDNGKLELEYIPWYTANWCSGPNEEYCFADYKLVADTLILSDKNNPIPDEFRANFKYQMPDPDHLTLKRKSLNPETYPYFYHDIYRDDFTDLAYEQQINIIANDGLDFTWVKETDSSYLVFLWSDTAFQIINSSVSKNTIIKELYHSDNYEYSLSELKLADAFENQQDFSIELPAEIYISKQGAIFHCRFKNQGDDNSFYLVYNLRMY